MLNRYGLVDENLVDLVEMDEGLRSLQRQFAAGNVSHGTMARALERAGRRDEALPHWVKHYREQGDHDRADQLELAPLAENFQRSMVDHDRAENERYELTGSDSPEDARRLEAATERAGQARRSVDASHGALRRAVQASLRARGHGSSEEDVIRHGQRFFRRDLAPDPGESQSSGFGLVRHLGAWADTGNVEQDFTPSIRINSENHSTHDRDWNSRRVQAFKDSLDHHNLGTVTEHEVIPESVTRSQFGDPNPDGSYTLPAGHTLTVSPAGGVGSRRPRHADPVNLFSYLTGGAYATPSDYHRIASGGDRI